jgi:formylglycine-generating enzyme required for sulfatase activity
MHQRRTSVQLLDRCLRRRTLSGDLTGAVRADARRHAEPVVALSDRLRAAGLQLDPLRLGRVAVLVRRLEHADRATVADLIVAALASPDLSPARLRPLVAPWAEDWWPEDRPEPPPIEPPLPPVPHRRAPAPRPTGWSWSDIDPHAWLLMAACLALSLVSPLLPRQAPQELTFTAPLTDADGDQHAPPADCDDADPSRHPGAPDRPDGIDQDCDGVDGPVEAPPPAPRTVTVDSPTFAPSPAPSRTPWSWLTLTALALGAALAGLLWPRPRATQLAAPADPPLQPSPEQEVLLLDPATQTAVLQSVERRQVQEPSPRLDAEATVTATTRRGGLPTLRYQRTRAWHGLWIWQQQSDLDEPARLAADLSHALRRAGLPVRWSRYRTIPQRLEDEHGETLPTAAREDERAARVLVLQRCDDLTAWAEGNPSRSSELLRAMSRFPDLLIVGFGPGFDALHAAVTPLGLRAVPASDVLAALTDTAGLTPDLPSADLRRWQEAMALLPDTVTFEDALRLRRALQLDVSALLWPRAAGNPSASAVSWSPVERARHLEPLRAAIRGALPARLTEPLAFWRSRCEDDPVTLALLDLWDNPERAARALSPSPRVRRELGRCVTADAPPADGPVIVLPWRHTRHPEAWAALRRLGLSADLRPMVQVPPGRRIMGAAGLVTMAAGALAAAVGAWTEERPAATCTPVDDAVVCVCVETTCVAATRFDVQQVEVEAGASVLVGTAPRELPCEEARGELVIHRCTADGRVPTDPGERRPAPTVFALLDGTGASTGGVREALLGAGTADMVISTDLFTRPLAAAAATTLGALRILGRLVPWEAHPDSQIPGATPITAGIGEIIVRDWSALTAHLTALQEDTTLADLRDLFVTQAGWKDDLSAATPRWNEGLAPPPVNPATPILRAPSCGDAQLHPGEACDDGPANSDTRPDACRSDCQPARCGDGVVDAREACDGAGCRPDCAAPIRCGNGEVEPPEQCDAGPANHNGEPGACRADCRIETCGDGVLNPGEACDPARDPTCRADCTRPRCGDGLLDPGEVCDAGRANSDTAPNACRPTCQPAGCGDGVVDAGEDCDSTPGCPTTCQRELRTCGDGARDPGEQCDLGAARNARALDCDPACRIPTVTIPGGLYTIGSPPDAALPADEQPTWRLKTAAFTVQRTEVTRALYAQVMGAEATNDLRPVGGVPWEDARAFCAAVGGRLPTEAEWEAAARHSSPRHQRYAWGDELAAAARHAWTATDAPQPVATAPAPGPLPDIAGNVWEWTSDCWEPDIYPDRALGLAGVDSPTNTRCEPGAHIARGGSWRQPAEHTRLAHRLAVTRPGDDVGLRCAWGGTPRPDDGLRWVHVPAGPHWIGVVPQDPYHDNDEVTGDEKPAWQATFTGGFDILATEVTEAQRRGFTERREDDRLPWNRVNWHDASAFCAAHGARLPGEAEWEAAARGGTKTLFACGTHPDCLARVVAFESYGLEGQPVATSAPNAWGLYDAYGNLWEWTADCYDAEAWSRFAPATTDPGIVDMSTCEARALRGGAFWDSSWDESWRLRSSYRYWGVPSVEDGNIGFRCVRGVRRQLGP